MRHRLMLLSFLVFIVPAIAQQQAQHHITAEDYARAERFLGANTTPLVSGIVTRPIWIPGERLVYRNSTPDGFEFVLADPAARTRRQAFDHVKLAKALSILTKTTYEQFNLPFTQFEFSDDGRSITFNVRGRRYTCSGKLRMHC